MRLFVNRDNTLDVAANDSMNPDNLPIIEVAELPAPIKYCIAVKDKDYTVQAVDNWREKEKAQSLIEYQRQLNILLDLRMSDLMKPLFKSRAEVYAFAGIEGPLQEKAKELVSKFNVYLQLSQEALNGEISVQSLQEFHDLICSE